MTKIIVIAVFFMFAFMSVTLAESFIKAEVDKTSITTKETITYKLSITSSEKNLPTPQIPKFTGFNAISQAQSSTISFVKSEIKTVLVYVFILAPTDMGKFKIEPSVIKIKGKTYSSETFEIEVVQKPSQPEEFPPESEKPQLTL